jgi:hypothetical protein
MMLRAAILICMAAVAVAPPAAHAAAPSASTAAATNVTGTGATLNGTVSPNKETTTYRFQYGTTTAYGSTTPTATLQGNASRSVAADVTGLAPHTTYHFRVVATNASGTATGADVTLTTTAGGPAPAITIGATPTVVRFGRSVTIAGQAAGSPNAKATLEQSPFPYTDPFKNAADGTTDGAANYSFQVTPALNTRYHVSVKNDTSADVTVGVRPKVRLRLGDRTPRRGQRVRFKGSVKPAHDGMAVRIQRRTRNGWRTIAMPLLRPAAPIGGVARSKYRKRVRIRRSGAYRTVLAAHGDHARGKSPKRRARVH